MLALQLRLSRQVLLPYWRPLFLAAVVALVALTAVRTAIKVQTPSRTGEQSRTAFLRWRPQILALDRGTDIYKTFNYPNPPVMALLLKPLTALPPTAGALTWFALKVLMAALMAVMVFRLLESPRAQPPVGNAASPTSGRLPDWVKALAIAVSFHPILGDLSHGNVNLLIAFLIVLGLDCYRRHFDFAAGAVIALAIACKVTPALFIPYFLWRRAWRTLLGIGAGLVLWWAILPGTLLGFDFNATLLVSWFDGMVKPFLIDGQVTSEHPNQSLPGLLTRLATENASFLAYSEEDGRPVAAATHTLVNLGPGAVAVAVKAAMLAFAAFFVWAGRCRERSGLRFAAECGLIVLGMLLFSERTWKHHATTLLLPAAVLAAAAWRSGSPRLWTILAALPVLSLVPSALNGESQDLAMVYGVYTAAYALLAAGMSIVICTERTAAKAATPFT